MEDNIDKIIDDNMRTFD